MDRLFLTILNMSITGAFVIAVICLARLPLKKAPKILSYCLWAVVGFRLVFPFSIESIFSSIPFNAAPIPADIATQPVPRIESGIPFVNEAVSSVLPAPALGDSVNPLQIWTAIGAYIWILGFAVMFIYGIASYILLKRKMRGAVYTEANIYEADNIKSPFILGIFTPKIYMPVGLSEKERGYILLHEQTHIRRRDYIIKFAAYFILCLHWFNPLAWAAFLLMGVDMEMSCDERVLKDMGEDTKADYSRSLLSLATERRGIGGSPLAFGEGGVKQRIKNVLKFRKFSRAVMIAAVFVVAALSVGLALNSVTALNDPPEITIKAGDLKINWDVVKLSWSYEPNSITHSSWPDRFMSIMSETTFEDLPYIRNGEKITIIFDGKIPDSVTLTEYILRKDGRNRYNINGMEYDINFGIITRSGTFEIKPNYATGLSSYSGDYEPGNTIKGYMLRCKWGNFNEAVYSFIIRGDAAITMTHTGNEDINFFDPVPVTADLQVFTLENLTETQRNERLSYVVLYGGGINTNFEYEYAVLGIPPVSSNPIPNLYYRISGDELIIFAVITPGMEDVFDMKDGDTVAVFTIADANTLIFKSSAIPLFADVGARYIAPSGAAEWNGETRSITLDDIRSIAQNINVNLTMNDLRGFIGTDIGHGIVVMQYFVENSDYILTVGHGGIYNIFYALLTHATDGGLNDSIDIRYNDVEKFIADGTIELLRSFPELEIPAPPAIINTGEFTGLPFVTNDVTHIEMFTGGVPAQAVKKSVTRENDINIIIDALNALTIEREATMDDWLVGGIGTTFYFHLADGSSYTINNHGNLLNTVNGLYVVNGTSLNTDRFWDSLHYEEIRVASSDLPVIN